MCPYNLYLYISSYLYICVHIPLYVSSIGKHEFYLGGREALEIADYMAYVAQVHTHTLTRTHKHKHTHTHTLTHTHINPLRALYSSCLVLAEAGGIYIGICI